MLHQGLAVKNMLHEVGINAACMLCGRDEWFSPSFGDACLSRSFGHGFKQKFTSMLSFKGPLFGDT
jgi:hypothetical protein